MTGSVAAAYDAQAARATDLLGTAVHPLDRDRELIEPWAQDVDGRILDVGSGTGRWAGRLAQLGHDVEGMDPAARLVDLARRAHPAVPFRVAAIEDLAGSHERWSGVLAWYSLIHLDVDGLRQALPVLHHVLAPTGALLLSFFHGPKVEPLAHPVATAYRIPVTVMSEELTDAGFSVLDRKASDQGQHAVIFAQAR